MVKLRDMPSDLIELNSHDKLFDPLEFQSVITDNVIRIFGCMHCEWKGSVHCPHNTDPSWFTGSDLGLMICDKRKSHLLSLSPPLHRGMSWAEWQRGFNLNYSEKIRNDVNMRLQFSYSDLVRYQDKLSSFVIGSPEYNSQLRLLDFLKKDIRSLESRIDGLTKFIVHYQDQQMNRDSTKKISVEKSQPSAMDLGRMIKDVKEVK